MKMLHFFSPFVVLGFVAIPAVSFANTATRLEPHHGVPNRATSSTLVHCAETIRRDGRPIQQKLNADFAEVAVPCHDHITHGQGGAVTGASGVFGVNGNVKNSNESTLSERKSRS